MELVEKLLEKDDQEDDSNEKPPEDSVSRYTPPHELHLRKAEWNQFKRGYEIPAAFEYPVMLGSFAGWAITAGDPVAAVSIGAINLPFSYGVWNTMKADNRKDDIDSKLENWYLLGEDYDLSELFEESEPVQEMSSERMLNSYQKIFSELEDVGEEISELTETSIANEDFMDDYSYGIQMVRIEEENDFGGYNFEVNVYLKDKQIGVYRGNTTNEEIIEKLKSDGVPAEDGRSILKNYFDLGKPLGQKWTKPEPV